MPNVNMCCRNASCSQYKEVHSLPSEDPFFCTSCGSRLLPASEPEPAPVFLPLVCNNPYCSDYELVRPRSSSSAAFCSKCGGRLGTPAPKESGSESADGWSPEEPGKGYVYDGDESAPKGKSYRFAVLTAFFLFACILLAGVVAYLAGVGKRDGRNEPMIPYSAGENSVDARAGGAEQAPTPSSETVNDEAAIREIVMRYPEIKRMGTSDLNDSVWDGILVYPILEKQKRSTCWLRKHDQRYVFGRQDVSIGSVVQYGDTATVTAVITESLGRYRMNGSTIRPMKESTYQAAYRLKKVNGSWYISCLEALKAGDPLDCDENSIIGEMEKQDMAGENACLSP